jgi:IS605 OrfB family transposase
MKKAYFSRRLYKSEMDILSVTETSYALELFNCAKRFAFQTLVREKRWGRKLHQESLHIAVKKKYGLNDYFANSAVREANALFSSLMELNKMHIQQTEEKIKDVKKKLKTERTKLTKLGKIKESCIKGNLRFPKNTNFVLHKNGIISLALKNRSLIWMNSYLFEHRYLDVKMKRTKAKIGRLKHRLYRLEQKKMKLKEHIPSAVFGGKKLFKQQFTKEELIKDHEAWRKRFLAARNKEIIISGRKDAGSGNFVFHYNPETNELHMTSVTGKAVTFSGVVFPYGQEIVNKAVTDQIQCKNKKEYGKPISWSVEDHGEYYIIKCLVDIESNPYIHFSTSDGVIGVDCNYNHIAWTDVSKDGNFLESGKLKFSIEGKTSGQITKIIEAEAIALVDIAVRKKKPIVLEKLDTTLSKVGNKYGNKKANRMKSMFAYRKMIQAIKSRADKMGVGVIEVNPAFTSVSGKLKYMRKFGISIHQAAAFTIGRRGLGYKEKTPKVLKKYVPKDASHHWKHWSILGKKFLVCTHTLYHLFNVNQPHQGIDGLHPSLLEEEKRQLIKALA